MLIQKGLLCQGTFTRRLICGLVPFAGMANQDKVAALFIVVLLAVSGLLILAAPASASIPKPSVPEFTVQYVVSSYSLTTTDPYTGLTTTQQLANSSIQVTIKNQPAPDSTHQIYYNIRSKPHFEGNWTELYPIVNVTNAPFNGDWTYSKYLYYPDFPKSLNQSTTEFTVVSLVGDYNGYSYTAFPLNAEIDFQVEAIVGHDSQAWAIQHPFTPTYGGFYEPDVAVDSDSGWSSIQTVTVGGNAASSTPTASALPSQNPTAIPTQPQAGFPIGLDWENIVIVVLVVVVVCLAVGMTVLWRKVNLKR
jgi:hypothetical protein